MKALYKNVCDIAKKDHKNLAERTLKLTEEVGELSAEVLKLNGKKGSKGKLKPEVQQNIVDECADVYVRLISVCEKAGVSYNELMKAIKRKADKMDANNNKQGMWEGIMKDG